MTTAPPGWRRTTLGELGRYLNGRAFKKSEWAPDGRPIIRIQNLTGSNLTYNHFRGDVEDRYVVRSGDLLVSWAATLGAYVWTGQEAVLNQHIFKVESNIDVRFHKHLLDHKLSELRRHTHGSGMVHITRGRFDSLPAAVPPLAEQCRIVDVLEDHLSRLGAAESYLLAARGRAKVMVKAVLLEMIPEVSDYPSHWESTVVGEAGMVGLGRQRHPDWHTGPTMRSYLRVANVFEDRIDISDLKQMHWPDKTFERFRLHLGDVLLNEGQTPELLGRPAIYRGIPADVAFTNTLIRFKVREDVLPEFALLVFRRHMHAGRFTRESRITTNIAHLSAARLKTIEFPVPPLAEQASFVARAAEQFEAIDRLEAAARVASARGSQLRKALLAAAFSGQLTGRESDMDRVEEMALT